jgi:hypothetical protein
MIIDIGELMVGFGKARIQLKCVGVIDDRSFAGKVFCLGPQQISSGNVGIRKIGIKRQSLFELFPASRSLAERC